MQEATQVQSVTKNIIKIIEEKLTEAAKHRKKGNIDKAKSCYKLVLTLDKNNIIALEGMVSIYKFQENQSKAKKFIAKLDKVQVHSKVPQIITPHISSSAPNAQNQDKTYIDKTSSDKSSNTVIFTLPAAIDLNSLLLPSSNACLKRIKKSKVINIIHPKRIENINEKQSKNGFKLFDAIDKRDLNALKILLEQGCDVDALRKNIGYSAILTIPLYYALSCYGISGDNSITIELSKLLIKYGASISHPECPDLTRYVLEKLDFSTIITAINLGNPYDSKKLVAELLIVSEHQLNNQQKMEILKALVEKGIDAEWIIQQCLAKKKLGLIQPLLPYTEGDEPFIEGLSPLGYALLCGHIEEAKLLLAGGTSFNNTGDEFANVLRQTTMVALRSITLELDKELYEFLKQLIIEQLAFSGAFRGKSSSLKDTKKGFSKLIQPIANVIKSEITKCLLDKNVYNQQKQIFEVEEIKNAIKYAILSAEGIQNTQSSLVFSYQIESEPVKLSTLASSVGLVSSYASTAAQSSTKVIKKPQNTQPIHPRLITNLSEKHRKNGLKLFEAIKNNDTREVKKLLEQGCDVNIIINDKKYRSSQTISIAYCFFVIISKKIEIAELLIEYGAALSHPVDTHFKREIVNFIDLQIILNAIKAGNPCDQLDYMIRILKKDEFKNLNTSEKIKALEILLERGVDPVKILFLCLNENIHILQFVLQYVQDIDRKDSEEFSPLGSALFYGLTKTAKFLLLNGANLTKINDDFVNFLKQTTMITMRKFNMELNQDLYQCFKGLILEQLAFSGKFQNFGNAEYTDKEKSDELIARLVSERKKSFSSSIEHTANALKDELIKCLHDKKIVNLEKGIVDITEVKTAVQLALNSIELPPKPNITIATMSSPAVTRSSSIVNNPHAFFAPATAQPVVQQVPVVVHHYQPPPRRDFAAEMRQNLNTVAAVENASANLISAFSNAFN